MSDEEAFERITDAMERLGAPSCHPVLKSALVDDLGDCWSEQVFDEMIRTNFVKAEFPEARPGDSGRQFWSLVYVVAIDEAKP